MQVKIMTIKHSDALPPPGWHTMKNTILENSVWVRDLSMAAHFAAKYSQAGLIREAFIDAAIDKAELKGLLRGTSEAWDILKNANAIADDLISPAMDLPSYASPIEDP
jgi:hypothetical protein